MPLYTYVCVNCQEEVDVRLPWEKASELSIACEACAVDGVTEKTLYTMERKQVYVVGHYWKQPPS